MSRTERSLLLGHLRQEKARATTLLADLARGLARQGRPPAPQQPPLQQQQEQPPGPNQERPAQGWEHAVAAEGWTAAEGPGSLQARGWVPYRYHVGIFDDPQLFPRRS